MLPGVNRKLMAVAAARGGWFNRSDALACGYTPGDIRQRLDAGRWRRLCRDGYIDVDGEPAVERPWERTARLHRLAVAAMLHRTAASAVASHQSAVVLHELPTWDLDLARVHLTKPAGRSRTTGELVVHRARLAPADVVTVRGLAAMCPARAVVEAACGSTYEVAVVLFDAVLRDGLATREELAAFAHRLRLRAGSPNATNALRFADGRSESVGESRLRVLMAQQGLPEPELQVDIVDYRHNHVGRVDFLFRAERLVVEFDGALKYDAGGDVVAEKWREDRIRELGLRVIRFGWADLIRPGLTAQRIRTALARAVCGKR